MQRQFMKICATFQCDTLYANNIAMETGFERNSRMPDNNTQPLVSIVIPVYNSERYISRCLESVLGQTYSNVEVICVDDGSSDKSAEILDGYADANPSRVRVVHQNNAGAAVARNNGVALAQGAFLTFIDNDDWIDPDFVEKLVAAAQESGAEVVCSGYRREDDEGNVILQVTPKPSDEWGRYAVEAAWAKLYRTDHIRKNDITFLATNILEDLYFSLPAVELAKAVEVIDYCGYCWYWNTQSVSNTNQKKSEGLQFEQTIDALLAMLREKKIPTSPILLHYFVRLIAWFLLFTCKGDGKAESRKNLAHYTAWLDSNFPNWRDDEFARPARPTGDKLANRMAVYLFARHPKAFAFALGIYGGNS